MKFLSKAGFHGEILSENWILANLTVSLFLKKTGPEEAQYFHVRPPIGFI